MHTTESSRSPTPALAIEPGAHLRVPSVQEAIEAFLRAIRLEVKATTVDVYEKSLRPLCSIERPIADVTLDDLRRVYSELRDRQTRFVDHPQRPALAGPLSPYTLTKHIRGWKRFFAWLLDEQMILSNPARRLKAPTLPKKPPSDCSPEDLAKIIDQAGKSCARDLAIVLLLADSACRVGGLVGLRMNDIDLPGGRALVNEKGDRSRFVYFGERTRQAIEAYLEERPSGRGDWLFIGHRGHLQREGVYRVLKRLARKASVTGRCNPHSMRHAWARQALKKSGDLKAVSQVLGHSSLAVTAMFYAYYLDEELQERHAELSWVPGE